MACQFDETEYNSSSKLAPIAVLLTATIQLSLYDERSLPTEGLEAPLLRNRKEHSHTKVRAKCGRSIRRSREEVVLEVGPKVFAGDYYGDNGHYILKNFWATQDPRTHRHDSCSP